MSSLRSIGIAPEVVGVEIRDPRALDGRPAFKVVDSLGARVLCLHLDERCMRAWSAEDVRRVLARADCLARGTPTNYAAAPLLAAEAEAVVGWYAGSGVVFGAEVAKPIQRDVAECEGPPHCHGRTSGEHTASCSWADWRAAERAGVSWETWVRSTAALGWRGLLNRDPSKSIPHPRELHS